MLTLLAGLALIGGCRADPAPPAAGPAATVPATGSPDPASAPPTRPPSSGPGPATSAGPAVVAHTFPVRGRASYARTHHDYPATDIMAACGTPVVAVTAGTVLAVVRVDTWQAAVNAGATRGGLSVSVLGDDGVRYYGSHLSAIDRAVTVGARVLLGQRLGLLGRTGDASACHLHFGISPPCQRTGDWWIQRGTIWPWRYLDSWRSGGHLSPVAEVAGWQRVHGCPSRPLVDP